MFSNNATVTLIRNSNISNDYKNTYYFDTLFEQRDFFLSRPILGEETNVSSFKTMATQGGTFIIDYAINEIFNANYLIIRDYTFFNNKDFYCFITSIKMISEYTTEITYEVDVLQTYMFDYEFNYCYIEREHVDDDTIGLHTLDENLNVGELVTASTQEITENDYNIIILATEPMQDPPIYFKPPSFIGGVSIPTYWANLPYEKSSISVLKAIIDFYSKQGKADAIVSIFIAPATLGSTLEPIRENTVTVNKPILPVTPVNNKLYTYPFTCLVVETPQQAKIYKYELLDSLDFKVIGTFGENQSIFIYPSMYKGMSNDYSSGLNLSGFPLLPWTNDYYANWSAQTNASRKAEEKSNIINGAFGVVGGTVATVGGIATGNVAVAGAGAGAVVKTLTSSFLNVERMNAQKEQAQIIPDTMNGSSVASNTLFAMRELGIKFSCKTLKRENFFILDKYLSMYGYKVNKNKIPYLHTRKYWNFIKMVDCNLISNIPNEHLTILEKIYENGVTFWHDEEIGNYDRYNEIIV